MIEPIRYPGTGLSLGQGLNLQRYQPLSGEADHLTQEVIAGLFQQGPELGGGRLRDSVSPSISGASAG